MKGLSGVFGIGALIIAGAIVADIWSKPAGTAAAGNGLAALWTPSLQAVSGQGVTVPATQRAA